MNTPVLSHLVDPLREMLEHSEMVLRGYRERHDARILGLTCAMLPPEIVASYGILPVRTPRSWTGSGCCCGSPAGGPVSGTDVFDYVAAPRKCAAGNRTAFGFDVPSGYGSDAAEALHHALDDLLTACGTPGIRALDSARLAAVTDEYNTLRRLVRGISTLRSGNPGLLSHMDLMDIYEAASTLPPSTVTDPLAVILDGLNGKGRPEGDSGRIKAMVSGGCLADGGLLDLVESAGCLITEDDFCNGIRQFDMSHNASSEYLYYEILDAFSYSPLCPSLRPPEDRFELLFAMLKNYGIQMVIFLKDTMCSPAADELEYIRVRLMRSGVDPVITDTGSAVETLRSYLDAIR